MVGIYVHVPFCHAKCAYCDFYSIARTDHVERYAECIAEEYAARTYELGDERINTLYLGGGTPSLLPDDTLLSIIKAFPVSGLSEFTIEVNPEDITAERPKRWRNAGINRVSIGVQSLNDTELRAVRRRHSAAQALDAIKLLQDGGFDNISADLIYGLPGQTVESFAESLKRLIDTDITHLSAYCLSYEEGTTLGRKLAAGLITPTEDDILAEMYGVLCRTARATGFEHYEISNFAFPGYRARHNSSYWNSTPYLGLGPGAHSLGADGTRRYNRPDLRRWLMRPTDVLTVEEETEAERANDIIMTGLRTAEGLDMRRLSPHYAAQILRSAADDIRRGRLISREPYLLIPEEYFLVSDNIIRNLIIL